MKITELRIALLLADGSPLMSAGRSLTIRCRIC